MSDSCQRENLLAKASSACATFKQVYIPGHCSRFFIATSIFYFFCYSEKFCLLIFHPSESMQTENVNKFTHFWPMFLIYTPWKHQKTKGFLMFSGGNYKMGTLARNGLYPITKESIKVISKVQILVNWMEFTEANNSSNAFWMAELLIFNSYNILVAFYLYKIRFIDRIWGFDCIGMELLSVEDGRTGTKTELKKLVVRGRPWDRLRYPALDLRWTL